MTNYLRDEGRMSAVVIVNDAALAQETEDDVGDVSSTVFMNSFVKTDLVEQIT